MTNDPAVTVVFFASVFLLFVAAGAFFEWNLRRRDARRKSRAVTRRIGWYGSRRIEW